MSVLQVEVYQAFRTLNVEDDNALKAAVALSDALGKVVDDTSKTLSKRDADIDAIKLDIVVIKGELALHRWMLGFVLAGISTLIFKAFH